MKQVCGVWLPESDTHFKLGMIDKEGNYQKDTFDAAMAYVKEPKIFYDIGAHVGLWSLMAHRAGFKMIYAYEPNEENFACLEKNTCAINNKISLNNFGVSSRESHVYMIKESQNNSGAITFRPSTNLGVTEYIFRRADIVLPDSSEISPHQCLVKIDTEGMEGECARGIEGILCEVKPVVCVEQRSNQDALDILHKMGMQIVQQVRKDYILTWKN